MCLSAQLRYANPLILYANGLVLQNVTKGCVTIELHINGYLVKNVKVGFIAPV